MQSTLQAGQRPATWYQAGSSLTHYVFSYSEKGLQTVKTTNQDIRCGNCHKKLGFGQAEYLQIKCPRCGTMNTLRATSTQPERQERPAKVCNEGKETN